MKTIFKLIFFIWLIINVLTFCTGNTKTQYIGDENCSRDEREDPKCEAIENVMDVKCSENKATQLAYKGVNNGGETELCTFT